MAPYQQAERPFSNPALCATGNPGTQVYGHPILANDETGATPYKGKICAFLAYGQEMNTNDLQAVESGLRTRFGF